ncbi:MAG: hypothetical protein HYZ09_02535 [Candidatus Kerfeldbacteria bacterium]|nr:hypothetical protein [Candidatus Kerfeldbacteria bacterium]
MSHKLTLDPKLLRERLSLNWIVVVLPFALLLWVFVTSLIPPFHRLVCRRDAAEGREVLRGAFMATEKAIELPVYWSVINLDANEKLTARVTVTAWLTTTDTTDVVPPIDSTVAWLDCTAYETFGAVDVRYVLRSTLTPDGKREDRAKTRALRAGHAPHWTVRYDPPGTVDGNQRAIHPLLQRIAQARQSVNASLTADSLAAATRWWSFGHERQTRSFSERRTRIRIGAAIATLLLLVPLFGYQTVRVDQFCSARRHVYTERGVAVPAPSRWRLFWAWSPARYVLAYEEHCRNLQREVRRAVRLRKRAARDEQREQAMVEAFEDALQQFLDSLPTAALPAAVEAAIVVASDGEEAFATRRSAFERARSLLRSTYAPMVERTEEPPVVLTLDEQVAQATPHVRSLPQHVFNRYHDYVRKGRAESNPAKRTYWLDRALRVARGEEVVAEPARRMVAPAAASVGTAVETADVPILTREDLKQRLAVREFVPSHLCPEHVEEIIFELLEPTKRGQASFMSRLQTGKYRRPEPMLRHVRGRLGPAFDQRAYEAALDWLLDECVVLQKHKSHGHNLALNAVPGDATPAGVPVVERIIAFYQWVQRELTR